MASIQHYDVIPKPLVAEKSMTGIVEKRYCLLVHPEVNKTMIKEAVEKMFVGAKAESINTMSRPARTERGGMTVGQTAKNKEVAVQFTADSKEIEVSQDLQYLKLCGVDPR